MLLLNVWQAAQSPKMNEFAKILGISKNPLMQIERILDINQLDNITKGVVEAGRESLIIGVT